MRGARKTRQDAPGDACQNRGRCYNHGLNIP